MSLIISKVKWHDARLEKPSSNAWKQVLLIVLQGEPKEVGKVGLPYPRVLHGTWDREKFWVTHYGAGGQSTEVGLHGTLVAWAHLPDATVNADGP